VAGTPEQADDLTGLVGATFVASFRWARLLRKSSESILPGRSIVRLAIECAGTGGQGIRRGNCFTSWRQWTPECHAYRSTKWRQQPGPLQATGVDCVASSRGHPDAGACIVDQDGGEPLRTLESHRPQCGEIFRWGRLADRAAGDWQASHFESAHVVYMWPLRTAA